MGRVTVKIILALLLCGICACKQAEDFVSDEITTIENRQPVTFVPFSDRSLYLDGATGADPSLANNANTLMNGQPVNAYSFSFWFKMDTATSLIEGTYLSSDFDTEHFFSLAWQTGTSTLRYYSVYPNGGPTNSSTIDVEILNPQQWNHIVISYSFDSVPLPTRNTLRVYLNGEIAGEETIDGEEVYWLLARKVEILPSGKDLSPSYIDEMAFWRKELTLTEVKSLYGDGAPGDLALSNNDYTSWWRFGENSTLPLIKDEALAFGFNILGTPSLESEFAAPPLEDPFSGENSEDPLNDDAAGDGTTGGGGSDPFGGGSGGFGGELGDGSAGGNFP